MRFILSIVFIMIGFVGFSQLPKPLIGKYFNTTRKTNFTGFIGKNSSTIFTVDYLQINRKKQELNLRRFDPSDLQLVDSKNLYSIIDENFYNEPNEIFFQNDTIYLFSDVKGLKNKFNLISLETFNQYGDLIAKKIIDTLNLDDKYTISEAVEKEGFIIAKHNRFENIFEQTIELIAIGGNAEILWNKEIKSPISIQSLTIEKILYSVNAPVYILCDYGFELGRETTLDNSELINSKYALWGYDPKKKFLKEFDLRIKNRWINGIELKFNSKSELLVSGFMNETRNYSIDGVFSLKINSEMQVQTSNYYKYKRSFYSKFVDTKRLNKTKELDDIVLRDCIILEDDSYFVLGEHFYQFTERNYDPRTNITTTTENYNYNSIVAAYFDSNGVHMWTDRIPKFQHTVNDFGYFSSFSTMQSDDEVHLFFNDTDRNNELDPGDYFNYRSLFNNRKFQISYVTIGKNGIESRGPLVSNENNNFMLRAKQCYQIDKDRFYLYGETGKARKIFAIDAN